MKYKTPASRAPGKFIRGNDARRDGINLGRLLWREEFQLRRLGRLRGAMGVF